MAVEDIGARLVLDPGTFVATADAATDAVDKLNESLAALGVTADATMAKLTKTGDAAEAAGAKNVTASEETGVAAEEAGAAGVVAMSGHKSAVDDVTESTTKATVATSSLKTELESLSTSSLAKLGKWGLAGSIGIAGESIDQYMKYQKAMTQLVTQAGLAANRLPAIMQGGLNIGKQTGLNFNDIANQLYRIVSATSGLKETNKQILALGQSAADVAVLFRVSPGAPTEQVARLFGSLANAGRSGKLQDVGSNPAQMAALLNAAVGTGDIRGQDLIGALGRGVLQSGQAVGAKLPDILAWLDLSTRLGAQPSTSGTLIAHSLQQIATPSEQGTKAQMMLGIQQGTLQQIIKNQGIGQAVQYLMGSMSKFNPVANYPAMSYQGVEQAPGRASALAQLESWGMNPTLLSAFQAGTMTPAQTQTLQQFMLTKMFGGARQEIPVLSIAENPQLYSAIEAQIAAQDTSGTYNKDLSKALGTPSQQMDIAMRNLQAYSIELGQDLTPVLLKFVHGLVDVASFLNGHRAVLDALGGILGGTILAGVGVYSIGKMMKIIDGIGNIFGSIGRLSGLTSGSAKLGIPANTTALEENTGALTRLTGAVGTDDLEGGGAGKGGLVTTAEKDAPKGAGIGLGTASVLGAAMVYALYKWQTADGGAQRLNTPPKTKTQAVEGLNAQGNLPFTQELMNDVGRAMGGSSVFRKINNLETNPINDAAGLVHLFSGLWGGGSGSSQKPKPATLSTIQQSGQLIGQAIKTSGQSSVMSAQLARLNTIGDYLGTNSSEYKQQLMLYFANAQKLYGIKTPGNLSGPKLQQYLGYVETAGMQKAFYTDLNAQNKQKSAQKKFFLDSLSGYGDVSTTTHDVNTTSRELKNAKLTDMSTAYISNLKDQLQSEEQHLQTLHQDISKVTKTTDTQTQTHALVEAVKGNNQETNTLLEQINNTLQNLKLQVNIPTSGPGSARATAARS